MMQSKNTSSQDMQSDIAEGIKFIVSGGSEGRSVNMTTQTNFPNTSQNVVYESLVICDAKPLVVLSPSEVSNPDYAYAVLKKPESVLGQNLWVGPSTQVGALQLPLTQEGAGFWPYANDGDGEDGYTRSYDLAQSYDRGCVITSTMQLLTTFVSAGGTSLIGDMTMAAVTTQPENKDLTYTGLSGLTNAARTTWMSTPVDKPLLAIQAGGLNPVYFAGQNVFSESQEGTYTFESDWTTAQASYYNGVVPLGDVPDLQIPIVSFQNLTPFYGGKLTISLNIQAVTTEGAFGSGLNFNTKQFGIQIVFQSAYINSNGDFVVTSYNGGYANAVVNPPQIASVFVSRTVEIDLNIEAEYSPPPSNHPQFFLGAYYFFRNVASSGDIDYPLLSNLHTQAQTRFYAFNNGVQENMVVSLVRNYTGPLRITRNVHYRVGPNADNVPLIASSLEMPKPTFVRDAVNVFMQMAFCRSNAAIMGNNGYDNLLAAISRPDFLPLLMNHGTSALACCSLDPRSLPEQDEDNSAIITSPLLYSASRRNKAIKSGLSHFGRALGKGIVKHGLPIAEEAAMGVLMASDRNSYFRPGSGKGMKVSPPQSTRAGDFLSAARYGASARPKPAEKSVSSFFNSSEAVQKRVELKSGKPHDKTIIDHVHLDTVSVSSAVLCESETQMSRKRKEPESLTPIGITLDYDWEELKNVETIASLTDCEVLGFIRTKAALKNTASIVDVWDKELQVMSEGEKKEEVRRTIMRFKFLTNKLANDTNQVVHKRGKPMYIRTFEKRPKDVNESVVLVDKNPNHRHLERQKMFNCLAEMGFKYTGGRKKTSTKKVDPDQEAIQNLLQLRFGASGRGSESIDYDDGTALLHDPNSRKIIAAMDKKHLPRCRVSGVNRRLLFEAMANPEAQITPEEQDRLKRVITEMKESGVELATERHRASGRDSPPPTTLRDARLDFSDEDYLNSMLSEDDSEGEEEGVDEDARGEIRSDDSTIDDNSPDVFTDFEFIDTDKMTAKMGKELFLDVIGGEPLLSNDDPFFFSTVSEYYAPGKSNPDPIGEPISFNSMRVAAAHFPIVQESDKSQVRKCSLLISEVSLKDSSNYGDVVNIGGVSVRFDLVFARQDYANHIVALNSMARLIKFKGNYKLFCTVNPNLQLGYDSIQGGSWHMAFFAALMKMPVGPIYTGVCEGVFFSVPGDIGPKIGSIMRSKENMLVIPTRDQEGSDFNFDNFNEYQYKKLADECVATPFSTVPANSSMLIYADTLLDIVNVNANWARRFFTQQRFTKIAILNEKGASMFQGAMELQNQLNRIITFPPEDKMRARFGQMVKAVKEDDASGIRGVASQAKAEVRDRSLSNQPPSKQWNALSQAFSASLKVLGITVDDRIENVTKAAGGLENIGHGKKGKGKGGEKPPTQIDEYVKEKAKEMDRRSSKKIYVMVEKRTKQVLPKKAPDNESLEEYIGANAVVVRPTQTFLTHYVKGVPVYQSIAHPALFGPGQSITIDGVTYHSPSGGTSKAKTGKLGVGRRAAFNFDL